MFCNNQYELKETCIVSQRKHHLKISNKLLEEMIYLRFHLSHIKQTSPAILLPCFKINQYGLESMLCGVLVWENQEMQKKNNYDKIFIDIITHPINK